MKGKAKRSNEMTARQAANALAEMVRHNIKVQYRNSFLGVIWTLLNPLLNMIVLALVFSHIFSNRGIGMDYPVYIMGGNVIFSFFRMATTNCLPSIVNNRDLLTKTRIPHIIFPLSNVLSSSVNFLFSLVALLLVMLVRLLMGAKIGFYWTSLMIIPYFPAVFGFSLGIGLIVCTIYVRFRDIKHIYSVFLLLWQYGTPLFYSETILSDKMAAVMKFNPMYYFVKYFRAIMAGDISDWASFGICYASAALALMIGLLLFDWRKRSFTIYV